MGETGLRPGVSGANSGRFVLSVGGTGFDHFWRRLIRAVGTSGGLVDRVVVKVADLLRARHSAALRYYHSFALIFLKA